MTNNLNIPQKKIAFVLKLFQGKNFHGGGEKLFYKLINGFISKNYIIDVYCSKSDILEYAGINKITIVKEEYDHTKPESMERFYNEVKLLTSNKNYTHIISENITPPLDITFLQGHSLIHRKKQNKNFIEAFLYNFRPVKRTRIKFQEKWLKEGYNKIFVPSKVVKSEIMNNFGIEEEKIFVVYPGVDINDKISPLQHNQKSDNTVIFGVSAPGFKIKGGFVLLKALHYLKKQTDNFKVKIIYPKYKKNLGVKLLIKLYGIEKNIEFLGFQKNMPDFYNSIDCLIMPSIEDTFGLVAPEAMANNKFCIISSNAGASEIIKNGQNGFIFNFDKNKEKNLAEIMNNVINNTENFSVLSANALETAKEFSWEKTFTEFERLCNRS